MAITHQIFEGGGSGGLGLGDFFVAPFNLVRGGGNLHPDVTGDGGRDVKESASRTGWGRDTV